MAVEIKTILSHEVLSASPAGSPPAGFLWQYALADGFYEKNSSGVETKITNVSGAGISAEESIINALIFG
jgi:hypothetical protein